ncbi:efflux RND transporter permease subunit, partial [Frankia sp. Cpl3]|nr:efflux RND transporter permease subunit [Frankia sp. Cpl3]
VGISGGKDRIIEVTIDPDRLAAYGLTIEQIQQALRTNNTSGAAGSIRQGDEKLSIRVEGEYASASAIGETPIQLQNNSILLKNIATIK